MSCGQPPIKGDLDRSGKELKVTITFYDNEKSLNEFLTKRLKNWEYKTGLQGQAIWSNTDNTCEVHLLRPKSIDDDRTKTLGHEMLHCIYGTYHK
jgi:hypothetical protein